MRFTDEMKAEDEKRWHARDIVTELGYCGDYMSDRKNITNLDIRFYAYIMRRAAEVLKDRSPAKPEFDSLDGCMGRWRCGNCHISLAAVRAPYCWHCGKAVKWDA